MTVTNLVTNPSVETGLTGWGVQWYGGGSAAGTAARTADIGYRGVYAYRKTWIVGGDDGDSGFTYVQPVVAGRFYAFSVAVRASKATGMHGYLYWADSAGAAISSVGLPGWDPFSGPRRPVTPANTWQTVSGVAQPPAGAASVRFAFGAYTAGLSGDGAVPVWAPGDTHDTDALLIAEVPALTSPVPAYFDGDTADSNPDYYGWTGTPHASTSTHIVSSGVRLDQTIVTIAGLGGGVAALAGTNLVTNPSFENGLAGWRVPAGHTFARTNVGASVGTWAATATLTSPGIAPAILQDVYAIPVTPGEVLTFVAQVKGPVGRTAQLWIIFRGTATTEFRSAPVACNGAWQRLTYTATAPASATTVDFGPSCNVAWAVGETLSTDAVMVVRGAETPAYFDGDTPDTAGHTYAWTGTPHASTSTHTTIPVTDATCYVDRVTMRHGRDDYGEQPEADSITLEMSVDHNGNAVPAIEVGADITVTHQVVDIGPVFTRFRGRVSDVNRSWEEAGEDTPDRGTCQVVAVSSLGELGRRLVGDQPWPQELDGARVLRVLQLAYPTLPAINVDPGIYQVVARDVDRKDALSLIQDTADAGGGILWTKAGDPFPHYADFEHRRGTVAALEIDACDILASPTWTRDLSGLCNYVSLTYGLDPVNPPDGAPTEAPSLTSRNQASVDKYGEYGLSVRLELANQADAQARASLLTTRNGTPAWVLSDLPLDMGGLSTADVETVLGLDMHALILLTGLPTAGSAPTSAYAWIEGWNEVLAAGVHDLTLAVSGYCATSPPVRWNDVPPEPTWDTADPTWTWDSVVCIGPTPNRGRWDDVPATTRWDTIPPATTWDTWPTT